MYIHKKNTLYHYLLEPEKAYTLLCEALCEKEIDFIRLCLCIMPNTCESTVQHEAWLLAKGGPASAARLNNAVWHYAVMHSGDAGRTKDRHYRAHAASRDHLLPKRDVQSPHWLLWYSWRNSKAKQITDRTVLKHFRQVEHNTLWWWQLSKWFSSLCFVGFLVDRRVFNYQSTSEIFRCSFIQIENIEKNTRIGFRQQTNYRCKNMRFNNESLIPRKRKISNKNTHEL